jgi:hypothetical protein
VDPVTGATVTFDLSKPARDWAHAHVPAFTEEDAAYDGARGMDGQSRPDTCGARRWATATYGVEAATGLLTARQHECPSPGSTRCPPSGRIRARDTLVDHHRAQFVLDDSAFEGKQADTSAGAVRSDSKRLTIWITQQAYLRLFCLASDQGDPHDDLIELLIPFCTDARATLDRPLPSGPLGRTRQGRRPWRVHAIR